MLILGFSIYFVNHDQSEFYNLELCLKPNFYFYPKLELTFDEWKSI